MKFGKVIVGNDPLKYGSIQKILKIEGNTCIVEGQSIGFITSVFKFIDASEKIIRILYEIG